MDAHPKNIFICYGERSSLSSAMPGVPFLKSFLPVAARIGFALGFFCIVSITLWLGYVVGTTWLTNDVPSRFVIGLIVFVASFLLSTLVYEEIFGAAKGTKPAAPGNGGDGTDPQSASGSAKGTEPAAFPNAPGNGGVGTDPRGK